MSMFIKNKSYFAATFVGVFCLRRIADARTGRKRPHQKRVRLRDAQSLKISAFVAFFPDDQLGINLFGNAVHVHDIVIGINYITAGRLIVRGKAPLG